MSAPLLVTFEAGDVGGWKIRRSATIAGPDLPAAASLRVREGASADGAPECAWRLRGLTSHVRYTTRSEVETLKARQEGLSRPQASRAALIPIRKTPAWWALAQDERRAILEERSRHIAIGLEYLPEVARRLHHCRDFGEGFDFLTWFEFAPEHETQFDILLERLRASEEWSYIDREIDIRLERMT